MPENLVPPPAAPPASSPAESAPGAKALTADQRRQAVHEIMQEVGFSPGNGPPSPDLIARMQALAKERGVELPERILGGVRASSAAPVFRTIYRLSGGEAPARPEAVRVRLGITDGTSTEAIDGLREGDLVITGINGPADNSNRTNAMPFGGGIRRGF
jgi:HlyD family secretion protein